MRGLTGEIAGDVARRLRRISGVGEAELIPQARLSGPMPWVIAIMVALTVIAVAAGLALRNSASSAADQLAGGVTVQIVEASPEARAAQAKAATALLEARDDVVSVEPVAQADLDALIEPWLGSDALRSEAVPIPALIDVRLDGMVNEGLVRNLQADLRRVAPAARVDAQSDWLAPVFSAISSLQWLAIALVLLLALALAASVLLAARTAMGTNRETIEIVHLLGGTDAQVARVLQRSFGIDAAGGGLVGLGLAAIVIALLGRSFGSLGAGLVAGGALGWSDWLLLTLVPLSAVGLAMLTARLTVMHTLRKMV